MSPGEAGSRGWATFPLRNEVSGSVPKPVGPQPVVILLRTAASAAVCSGLGFALHSLWILVSDLSRLLAGRGGVGPRRERGERSAPTSGKPSQGLVVFRACSRIPLG